MALEYTITDLPAVWPGKRTSLRIRAPFKTQNAKTMKQLERELRQLGAKKVELAVEIRGAFDIRQDGMLRADARPGPAVILSFIDRDGQRQAYPCDRFAWWQDNLYAIAVVLEDLRRAERYGVQSSLIRAGFKALPATTVPVLSTEAASAAIARRVGGTITEPGTAHATQLIARDRTFARDAIRRAVANTHPDAGGSNGDFHLVQEAKRVLEAHHGGSL